MNIQRIASEPGNAKREGVASSTEKNPVRRLWHLNHQRRQKVLNFEQKSPPPFPATGLHRNLVVATGRLLNFLSPEPWARKPGLGVFLSENQMTIERDDEAKTPQAR
jgi:hypothetical protein